MIIDPVGTAWGGRFFILRQGKKDIMFSLTANGVLDYIEAENENYPKDKHLGRFSVFCHTDENGIEPLDYDNLIRYAEYEDQLEAVERGC